MRQPILSIRGIAISSLCAVSLLIGAGIGARAFAQASLLPWDLFQALLAAPVTANELRGTGFGSADVTEQTLTEAEMAAGVVGAVRVDLRGRTEATIIYRVYNDSETAQAALASDADLATAARAQPITLTARATPGVAYPGACARRSDLPGDSARAGSSVCLLVADAVLVEASTPDEGTASTMTVALTGLLHLLAVQTR